MNNKTKYKIYLFVSLIVFETLFIMVSSPPSLITLIIIPFALLMGYEYGSGYDKYWRSKK